jgi:hypothetical protein
MKKKENSEKPELRKPKPEEGRLKPEAGNQVSRLPCRQTGFPNRNKSEANRGTDSPNRGNKTDNQPPVPNTRGNSCQLPVARRQSPAAIKTDSTVFQIPQLPLLGLDGPEYKAIRACLMIRIYNN